MREGGAILARRRRKKKKRRGRGVRRMSTLEERGISSRRRRLSLKSLTSSRRRRGRSWWRRTRGGRLGSTEEFNQLPIISNHVEQHWRTIFQLSIVPQGTDLKWPLFNTFRNVVQVLSLTSIMFSADVPVVICSLCEAKA